jgi:uncharacterized protein YdaU (DUF1376 family)
MSSRKWMPLYIGDFLADTMHLSATETGIYIRLIMHAWQHDGLIPRDKHKLAIIAHCSAHLWWRYELTMLKFFDPVDASTSQSRRVKKELARADEIYRKRKAAAEQMRQQKSSKRSANQRANAQQKLGNLQSHIESSLGRDSEQTTSVPTPIPVTPELVSLTEKWKQKL